MAWGKHVPGLAIRLSSHPYKDMVYRWGIFTQNILALCSLNIVISRPSFCLVMLETIQFKREFSFIMPLNVVLEGIPDLIKLVLLDIHIG